MKFRVNKNTLEVDMEREPRYFDNARNGLHVMLEATKEERDYVVVYHQIIRTVILQRGNVDKSFTIHEQPRICCGASICFRLAEEGPIRKRSKRKKTHVHD